MEEKLIKINNNDNASCNKLKQLKMTESNKINLYIMKWKSDKDGCDSIAEVELLLPGSLCSLIDKVLSWLDRCLILSDVKFNQSLILSDPCCLFSYCRINIRSASKLQQKKINDKT